MAIKRRLEGTSDDPDNCRDQGWVLKRQVFLHKSENWEVENVYESREIVCKASGCDLVLRISEKRVFDSDTRHPRK